MFILLSNMLNTALVVGYTDLLSNHPPIGFQCHVEFLSQPITYGHLVQNKRNKIPIFYNSKII